MLFVLQETLNRRDRTNLQKVTHLDVNILHRINSILVYKTVCIYMYIVCFSCVLVMMGMSIGIYIV